MKKYIIVEAKFISKLEEEVNIFIEKGFKPTGGVGVEAGGVGTMGGYKVIYYQALIYNQP